MTQNKLRNEIQELRKDVLRQFLYFNGLSLEYYSDEIQEIFDESMLEVLKENKGTPGQYKRLLKTYFTLKSIRDIPTTNFNGEIIPINEQFR